MGLKDYLDKRIAKIADQKIQQFQYSVSAQPNPNNLPYTATVQSVNSDGTITIVNPTTGISANVQYGTNRYVGAGDTVLVTNGIAS